MNHTFGGFQTSPLLRLLARIWLAAALALLAGVLCPSAAVAANGDQTTKVALKPLANGGANFGALWVFFDENLNTRGVKTATMTVKRTINNKVETSTVTGAVSKTNTSKLEFNASAFTFTDKVTNFEAGDIVAFTITLTGKDKVTVKNAGIFNDQTSDLKQTVSTSSFKFNIDPDYTVFNDLDILSGSDFRITIENLQFMINLTPDQFALLDPASLLGQTVTSAFTLSSSQALSPSFPTFDFFPNSFTEPAIGNYNVALGLLFNPDTGETNAFIHAIQAVPAPSTFALTVFGVIIVAARRFASLPQKRLPSRVK
jgi:hypothetical protein